VQGVERMTLGSYGIGCILLSGLFVYDIFWVFGTDVMVSVAKGLDVCCFLSSRFLFDDCSSFSADHSSRQAPIKLLFPKDVLAAEYQFSMLGLGDIVIPGTSF
jgi:minor histocompatibility antigen H13